MHVRKTSVNLYSVVLAWRISIVPHPEKTHNPCSTLLGSINRIACWAIVGYRRMLKNGFTYMLLSTL